MTTAMIGPRPGTDVAATCWCEARTVTIPATWVGDRTASCGSRECKAIEAKWRGEKAETPAELAEWMTREWTAKWGAG